MIAALVDKLVRLFKGLLVYPLSKWLNLAFLITDLHLIDRVASMFRIQQNQQEEGCSLDGQCISGKSEVQAYYDVYSNCHFRLD